MTRTRTAIACSGSSGPDPPLGLGNRCLISTGGSWGEPRKRQRSSWIRFEVAARNELWQSDFTHWRLADGSEGEILNWLDDHSRCLLACTVFTRVTGDDVVASSARPATPTAGPLPGDP
jgi:hypothetical protein